MRRAVPFLAAPLLLLALAAPAQAATYTSTGVRCTKVGTAGNDLLKGTIGRDVICGLGGNDRIYGGSGDDVIDGGSGSDTIDGGAGADSLLGGSGNDSITGSTGNDAINGGIGADTLSGADGTDRISGSDGNDRLSGGNGNDTLAGGTGDDVLSGSYGTDSLSGNDGNDDLDGGPDPDGIHGNAGTNWCTIDSRDLSRTQCVYDRTPPTVVSISASPSAVDVTGQDVPVLLRARIQDDTGVSHVQLMVSPGGSAMPSVQGGVATLVSGTVRDGWWQVKGVARRYGEPGTFWVDAFARDRVGRDASTEPHGYLTVRDDTPDRSLPVVTSLGLSSTSVDVRTSSGSITATARVTDDLSGSDPGDVLLCLHPPRGDGTYGQLSCQNMARVSGTRTDGVWQNRQTIPQGAIGGDWNVSVWLTDAAHPNARAYYFGPDVYRQHYNDCPQCNDPSLQQLPDDSGRFSVMGSSDNYAPVVQGLLADDPDVDTLPGPATVHVDVHATDAPGEGVTEVSGVLAPKDGYGDGRPSFSPVDAVLVQGTAEDGIWRLTFDLPQGTPPDYYPVAQVMISDKTHWRSYTTPFSPYAGQANQIALSSDQLSRADAGGPGWDGVITVVQHS